MLCNTAFTTRGSLTTHTKKEHKGHKIFMCDTCGKKFQTHKTLDVHRRVVHEQVSAQKFIKLDLFMKGAVFCRGCSLLVTQIFYHNRTFPSLVLKFRLFH